MTPLTTHSLVATGSSPSPSNHHQHWYRISSILMALTSIGLLFLTPSIFFHPSTYSPGQVVRLSLTQQRQTSLATLWGSATSFGIASYLFQWISRHQQQQQDLSSRLDKQLHFGLLVFCTLGLAAIPGEFGMKLMMSHALTSSPSSTPPFLQIMSEGISVAGLLVATMARITGFWTTIYGLQVASKSRPTSSSPLSTTETTATTATTSVVQSDQLQKSPEQSPEPKPVPGYQTKKNWFERFLLVPMAYRKQTLFYRNIMLIFMTAAGSNLMEALFRWRYRSALAQPFSALDISLSLSAGARLLLITILTYALKVGSESLPLLLLPTKSWKRNFQSLPNNNSNNNTTPSLPQDEEENHSNPDELASQSSISPTLTPTWTISQRHLAKSLSKVNLLVANWALVVGLGQIAMMRQPIVRSAAKPQMLLLAALLIIKSYRLWLCQGQGQDISPPISK